MIDAMRFVGGANMPGPSTGRLNATRPFGVLTIESDSLDLRVRFLRPLAKLFGVTPLECSAQDLADVFPCRGVFGTPGVGFRTKDGRRFYFWTGQIQAVLEVCRQQGFSVSTEEQQVTYNS
ncbi:hypothetical protein ACIPSJ_11800 [Streptomyces sp. NPDC090088]|uniref:hypothetical protein n=1 Tax=Streptomyces sp. NPDC090088 TaxID=3365944 RepID=UPI00382417D9